MPINLDKRSKLTELRGIFKGAKVKRSRAEEVFQQAFIFNYLHFVRILNLLAG